MTERLFGLETEYGLVASANEPRATRRAAVACDLERRAHAEFPSIRDAASGGVFIQNGARFYVDTGHHPEMTTPEVANPWDAVRYVLAGERLLERLLASATQGRKDEAACLFKTNVDYLTRSSWGCHESILHSAEPAALAAQIIPHLVSRVVYTGAGGFNPASAGVEFVLSPRSLFIAHPVSSASTSDRGIFHTKNEALCNGGHRRLHLICGESLCSETAMWLRTATTVLVVAMAEGGVQPSTEMVLDDPVGALWAIVGDATCRTRVAAASGRVSPLQIQRHFLGKAEEHVHAAFMPRWAEVACREWRAMLDRLEDAPDAVSTTLDWAIKRRLFERVLTRHGLDWSALAAWTDVSEALWARLGVDGSIEGEFRLEDLLNPAPALREAMRALRPLLRAHGLSWDGVEAFIRARRELFECDLRFSQLGGDGIFSLLDRAGVLAHHVAGVDDIEDAMENPPATGRARLRGNVIKRVQANRKVFGGAWPYIVNYDEKTALDLSNPFETEERWDTLEKCADLFIRGELPLGDLRFGRRGAALDSFVRGDYVEALRTLEALVAEEFQVPGTRCHMARVHLMLGHDAEARLQVAAAWEHRAVAPRYVVGRILWFLTLFALMDGTDISPWIGRLKTLGPDADAQMDWTMDPVLDALRDRLTADGYIMMSVLWLALAGSPRADGLDAHAWWRDTAPVPLD